MEQLNRFAIEKWWSPFVSTAALSLLTIFLLPTAILMSLNSRSGMLIFLALGVLTLPLMIARLHRIPAVPLLIGCYGMVLIGWFVRPESFDGNPALALATYFVPWLALASLFVAVAASLLKKRIQS